MGSERKTTSFSSNWHRVVKTGSGSSSERPCLDEKVPLQCCLASQPAKPESFCPRSFETP